MQFSLTTAKLMCCCHSRQCPTLANTHTHREREREREVRSYKHLPQLGLFSFNVTPASTQPQIPWVQAANLTESTHTVLYLTHKHMHTYSTVLPTICWQLSRIAGSAPSGGTCECDHNADSQFRSSSSPDLRLYAGLMWRVYVQMAYTALIHTTAPGCLGVHVPLCMCILTAVYNQAVLCPQLSNRDFNPLTLWFSVSSTHTTAAAPFMQESRSSNI